MDYPRRARPSIVLYAPAAIRHDPLPDASISVYVLPVSGDGIQAGANTAIVPASMIPAAVPEPAGTSSLPAFLLRPAKHQSWLPYTLMSYTGDDLLYVHLPGPAVHGAAGSTERYASWASDLSARHRAHGAQLNNHRCWLRNLLPGLEAEYKFTLPHGTGIWDLAVTTHQHVRAGAIDEWICEHGNDGGFTQGDYTSHLFAITRPASERGYIAFMPAINGPGYLIRRKRYTRDQMLRREDLPPAPELTADSRDLPQVIRDRYGLTPTWGATYRRVRYNVMLESLRTGHIFSIMYDRCTTQHAADLTQAEIEYVRSRTLHASSQPQILSQLSELRTWTRDLLTTSGIAHTEDHMSKLTWLRHQRRRPTPPRNSAEANQPGRDLRNPSRADRR
jgi:hypothetical protein